MPAAWKAAVGVDREVEPGTFRREEARVAGSEDHLPRVGALMFGMDDGQDGIHRGIQLVVSVNNIIVELFD